MVYLDPYKMVQEGELTAQPEGWLVHDAGLKSTSSGIDDEAEKIGKAEYGDAVEEDEESDDEYGLFSSESE